MEKTIIELITRPDPEATRKKSYRKPGTKPRASAKQKAWCIQALEMSLMDIADFTEEYKEKFPYRMSLSTLWTWVHNTDDKTKETLMAKLKAISDMKAVEKRRAQLRVMDAYATKAAGISLGDFIKARKRREEEENGVPQRKADNSSKAAESRRELRECLEMLRGKETKNLQVAQWVKQTEGILEILDRQ